MKSARRCFCFSAASPVASQAIRALGPDSWLATHPKKPSTPRPRLGSTQLAGPEYKHSDVMLRSPVTAPKAAASVHHLTQGSPSASGAPSVGWANVGGAAMRTCANRVSRRAGRASVKAPSCHLTASLQDVGAMSGTMLPSGILCRVVNTRRSRSTVTNF